MFVHGFLGSADSWENFPLDLVERIHGHNLRVYRFTLPSQGSYKKALVQLRNEILLLSAQLDGLIFLCHSLGGLLVAQMLDNLENHKVLGIIAFDAPYFGLSSHVSSVALSKTGQKVVDPVHNAASTVVKTSINVTKGLVQGVANVGYSVYSSTKYVSTSVVSSTSSAIGQVSQTAINITTSAFETSSDLIKSGPSQVISQTASYISEIPVKTMNYMIEIPVKSWEAVGTSIDSGKTALNNAFYGGSKIKQTDKPSSDGNSQERSIKELEKDSIARNSDIYTENIKTPLVVHDEKDLGTFLVSTPSDPWNSWIRLGLASVAIVSSGISYTTPVGFAKNLTKNLIVAHGVSALNEARKTIQFLYPPLWGDSITSITQRMIRLTDFLYFKCFYVVRMFLNLYRSMILQLLSTCLLVV